MVSLTLLMPCQRFSIASFINDISTRVMGYNGSPHATHSEWHKNPTTPPGSLCPLFWFLPFFRICIFPRLLFWISYFMLFYLPSFHNAVINSMYNGPPSFPLIICTTPQRRSSTLMWRLYRCLNTDHCFHRTALPLRIAGSLVYYIGALLCCSSFIPHFLFSASLLIPL
jgi:hypothetical protein